MTDIHFTPRTCTIFQRSIECNREGLEKRAKKIKDDRLMGNINNSDVITTHDGWDLSVQYFLQEAEDDDEDTLQWDTLTILLMIDRKNTCGQYIYGWKLLSDYQPEDFISLMKTYRCCTECGTFSWNGSSYCTYCYPFVTEHTEECCCCLEMSEGVWYKLPCGHILHKKCYDNIKTRKCPLCRAECHAHQPVRI